MRTFTLERNQVNIDKLDADLRAALDDVYFGMTVRDGLVILHAADDITDLEIETGRSIVQNHDELALTPEQQTEINLADDINTLKQSIGDIDAITNTEAIAAIRLIYKVLRLNELI